jgi:hypothetical protein
MKTNGAVTSDRTRPDPVADRHQPHNIPFRNHIPNRSKLMNLIQEDLARAQMTARLGEAHELRRGRQLALSRRLTRRSWRAAEQARLALARSV